VDLGFSLSRSDRQAARNALKGAHNPTSTN